MKIRNTLLTLTASATLFAFGSQAASASTQQHKVSNKKIGIMLALKEKMGYMDDEMIKARSYYNHLPNTANSKIKGDHDLSVNGDGTADTYFKVKGDKVTYHIVSSSYGKYKVTTHHTTVSALVKKYYSTKQQKDKINNYDKKIKNGPLH
ncbi:Lreu_0056 family protein [Lactobacillaceae bacterium Melli_B3]